MDDKDLAERQRGLCAAGYIGPVAEALAENGQSAMTAASLSQREVLDYYLTWNGIIGWTESILEAIDNAEVMQRS